MRPQLLPANVLRHFYAGGARIAALRGLDSVGDHMPEEWIGAVNTTFGATDGRGLSRLADRTLLRDAVAAQPVAWLGAEHVARYGADAGLLTKLLDAGQRLPVHFHPDAAFARAALGLAHGKTEAWIVLDAEPGASVWVGFAAPVSHDVLRAWMRAQDSAAMLAAMCELPVAAGDAIFVGAGTPHAIGAGILILELQEPSDLSALLEWTGFDGLSEADGHLGLGWDRVLEALDRSAWDPDRLAALYGPGAAAAPPGTREAPAATPGTDQRPAAPPGTGEAPVAARDAGGARSLLPAAADPFFRAEHMIGGDVLDAGFAILLVLEGSGRLGELPVARGDAVLIPHAAGALELSGDVAGIRCRPPAP